MLVNIELTNFTAGEMSPRLKGRNDIEKYYNGADTMLNMVTLPQGGATRRPGTMYVYDAKNQANPSRLVPFIFSTVQAYMLEFTAGNVRVFMNDGAVLSAGLPVDIAVPYTLADLKALYFVQSADTLYIAHPSYPPATLTRSSHTSWSYQTLVFLDGPYLDVNVTDTTLTLGGTSGTIAVTASSAAGINGGAGFKANDVGRLLRVKLFSLWAWLKIATFVDATHITATVQSKVNSGAYGAIDGAPWSGDTLYPTGAVVKSNGLYYRASSGGRSGPVDLAVNGPAGTGATLIDGSVIWSAVGSFNAEKWQQNTTYIPGAVVWSAAGPAGIYYVNQQGGTTSGASTAPSGTGINISDGQDLWYSTKPIGFPTATKDWALGRWGGDNGYPATVFFFQQRLTWGGYASNPNVICQSQVADFVNMAPTLADGTVTQANALTWSLDDDQVNAVRWLSASGSAQAMQLGIGTDAGEHVLQAANSQALSSESVQAYRETSYGSAANVPPLRIGKAVLFADRTGRKLREWSFFWQANGYIGPDLTQFSEHITRGPVGSAAADNGLSKIVYQQAPNQIVWGITNGGALIGFTYDREQQIFAPHRHRLGGNYYGGAPKVESIATIPAGDGTYDELWLEVLRTINGAEKRTIEVMKRFFDGALPDDAFFVDAGLSSAPTYLAATATPSGFTDAALAGNAPSFAGTGTLTASVAVFAAADVGAVVRLNGGKLRVTAFTDSQHVTAQTIVGMQSLKSAAANAWSCTRPSTSFSGLGHLEGETVSILGDGALYPDAVVVGGIVNLGATGAAVTAIGLNSNPVLVSMPSVPAHQAAGAFAGRIKSVVRLFVRFHESIGARFGRRLTDPLTDAQSDKLETLESRGAADPMDNVPPLFSGVRRLTAQGGYDNEGQFIVTQAGPLPLTVLSVEAAVDVNEVATA